MRKNDMLPEKMNNTKKFNYARPNATANRPMATLQLMHLEIHDDRFGTTTLHMPKCTSLQRFRVVNYFRKTLHLRCLTEF